MLRAIRDLLAELSGERSAAPLPADRQRLAAAALLHHAIAVDGMVTEAERTRLHELLVVHFGLGEREADELYAAAEAADNEAVDLFGFTNVLKQALSEEERGQIVEMMWELTFSDGALHEFEDNLIWRVSELLGISSRERIRLKHVALRGGAASN